MRTSPENNAGLTSKSLPFPTFTLLFGAALAVRGVFLWVGPWSAPDRLMWGDSPRYVVLANNLRAYGVFGRMKEEGLVHIEIARVRAANGTLPIADENGCRPESFRTPGYPVFILAILTFVDDLRAVLVVQNILGALLACLVAQIAIALGFSLRGALIAGGIWALHPGLILYDNLILTESLFNVCSILSLWIAARTTSRTGLVAAGLLLGAAGLVRPLGLLFLPASWALLTRKSFAGYRGIVCFTFVAALPTALWSVRNQTVGEGLRPSSVGDINLYYYTVAYSKSEERNEDWLDNWPARVHELTAQLHNRVRPGEDVVSVARSMALEYCRAKPAVVLRVLAKSQTKLIVAHSLVDATHVLGLPYQPSGLFSHFILGEDIGRSDPDFGFAILALIWIFANATIAFAALCGLMKATWNRNYCLLVVTGLTLLLFMVATGSVGLERLRMPMMLLLVLLAGYLCRAPGTITHGYLEPSPKT